MKHFLFIILFVVSLQAAELTYISNIIDEDNLKTLRDKYREDIIINQNRVYLIPRECAVARYFGGVSQNELITHSSNKQKEPITLTQEIFEAKDELTIKEELQRLKSIDLITGKRAKAFLIDTEGHLFGGASQTPIDLSKQRDREKKIYIRPKNKQQTTQDNNKLYKHPTCKLLNDGAGYQLYGIKDAKLYTKDGFIPISATIVLFN